MRKIQEGRAMRLIFATVTGVFLTMTSVSAAPPDVQDIVQQMKRVFEPTQPGPRKATTFGNVKVIEDIYSYSLTD